MGLIRRQSKTSGAGQGVGPPVAARLRLLPNGDPGPWLKGALHLSPGSLLWAPDKEGAAAPVELAAAAMVPIMPGQAGPPAGAVELDTPSGRVQLELDATLFEMSQELVNDQPPG